MNDDAPRRDRADRPPATAPARPPFSAILDSIPDLILACDDSFRLLFVNTAAERAFGLERAAAVGRDLREVLPASFGARLEAAQPLPRRRGPRREAVRNSRGSRTVGATLGAAGRSWPKSASRRVTSRPVVMGRIRRPRCG